MKKIIIGNDHAGTELKKEIILYLNNKYDVINMGTNTKESVDYPDIIHSLCTKFIKEKFEIGIIICGSGNGVSMVANKYNNIRAALSWNKELASLGRQHNDANILALPARFITKKEAIEILDVFLSTKFEGGRHKRRVDKIAVK
jgi:ribose 5-phosphate isomerase B